MSVVKKEIQAILDSLPDDCTYEDMQYRLYVMQKIREGMADAERGDVVPHDEVLKRFDKWLKK